LLWEDRRKAFSGWYRKTDVFKGQRSLIEVDMKAGLLSTQPLWMESALPTYPRLEHDLDVDVVVVGGGVTGITTAYLLRNEGLRVALIERNRVASGDTGHTTAHLTYVTDYRLHELAAKFGKDGARAFWTAGADAIEEIANIIKHWGRLRIHSRARLSS
jgi:ribosomal protein S9